MNKAQLQALLEHSSNGLLLVDHDNRIMYANAIAHTLFGAAPESLPGTRLPDTCGANNVAWLEHPGADNRMLELNGTALQWDNRPATLITINDVTRLRSTEETVATHIRRDNLITQLGEHILAGHTVDELRREVARIIHDDLGVTFTSVFAYDADTQSARLVACKGWPAGYDGHYTMAIDRTSPIGRALLGGKPTVVADWPNERHFSRYSFPDEAIVTSGMNVVVPHAASTTHTPWGSLGAYSAEARTFTPSDVNFVQRVAFLLAYATQREHLLAREDNNIMLLQEAGRVARIGGWETDPGDGFLIWSDEASVIHDLPAEKTIMTEEEAASYIAPESWDKAQNGMNALMYAGKPLDQELRLITAKGRRIWVRIIGKPILNELGQVVSARGAIQDITDQKIARDRIDFLALRDPLTQLPNRSLLEERLADAIAESHRTGQKAALMLLDLDDFKTINDTLGHAHGDLLLQAVAGRLTAIQREDDTTARFGGDEFALIINQLDADGHRAAARAEIIGRSLLDTLRQPYTLGQDEYHNRQSLGITLFGFDNDDPAELLKQADLTLYEAKARGRDQLCIFDPEMQEMVRARATMKTDIRRGLQDDEFQPFYQAQVDTDGHVIGAEVLARWHHPQRHLVSPVEFIPVAERSDLILGIGNAMLEKACRQLAIWAQTAETAALHLAVNVSARQFHHPEFVRNAQHIIESTGADPRRLVLELTETSIVEDIDDTVSKMTALGRYGVTFSLDDFGTGYSSLYYLKRLPLTQLKIDKSFVRRVDTDADNATIVRTIIALANAMNMNVIAEGVETVPELEFLTELGCQTHQGFLFARPQPIEQFQALLELRRTINVALYR